MTTVSVEEVEPRFVELFELAASGETVVVNANGVKMRLTPVAHDPAEGVSSTSHVAKGPRQLGQWKGQVDFGDDFFAPLSEEELKLWYGE